MQETIPQTPLDLPSSYTLPYYLLVGFKGRQLHMVACSQFTLSLCALTNLCSADSPPSAAFYFWTWDVLNLIRDAEEADGAA